MRRAGLKDLASVIDQGKRRVEGARGYAGSLSRDAADWTRDLMPRRWRRRASTDWGMSLLWFAGGLALGLTLSWMWFNNRMVNEPAPDLGGNHHTGRRKPRGGRRQGLRTGLEHRRAAERGDLWIDAGGTSPADSGVTRGSLT